MDEIELAQRVALVKEARRWNATRFHHRAAKLGHGVDCAHLLLEAHVGAGLAERIKIDFYPCDWHMHRDEEKFLGYVERLLNRVDPEDGEARLDERPDFYARPGNVLLWRYGRTFSHGAIVTEWPRIIHASFPAQCVLEESVMGGILATRPMRQYSFWGR